MTLGLTTEQKLAGGRRRWLIDNLIQGPPSPVGRTRPEVLESFTVEHDADFASRQKVLLANEIMEQIEKALTDGKTATIVVNAWAPAGYTA